MISKPKPILLRMTFVEKILGLKISQSRATYIFKALGFGVQNAGAGKIKVTPGSSRKDIQWGVDLAEELLRIEGFDQLAETLPSHHYSRERFCDKKAERIPELKKMIACLGFDEIMTYSLLSEKLLFQSGLDFSHCHAVANAASAEQAYFRPSLLTGMLQSILFNVHRKASSLKFFEIGNCYSAGNEQTRLALAMFGTSESNWQRKSESTFFDLKGVVENISDALKLFSADGVDQVRKIPQEILDKWGIPRDVFFCEIILDPALSLEPPSLKVKPVPKYPQVLRDIALVVDKQILVKDLENVLYQAATPYLLEVKLFDQYLGENIPPGKRSLAFSLAYQKENGTFTEEEIQTLQTKLGDTLKSRFAAEFR